MNDSDENRLASCEEKAEFLLRVIQEMQAEMAALRERLRNAQGGGG